MPQKDDSTETSRIVSHAAGVCWTTATCTKESVLVRNRDRSRLLSVSAVTGKQPFLLRGRGTWVVKLPPSHPFVVLLLSLGWEGRKNKGRSIPDGEIDLEAWTRGYCSIMAHPEKKRVRVYGSRSILEELNYLLGEFVGVQPKKIQDVNTRTGHTCALYYQGADEVAQLSGWLSEEPEYLGGDVCSDQESDRTDTFRDASAAPPDGSAARLNEP